MRRGKSIVGKDVLGLQDGVKINTVNDLVIDPNARSLVALVVDDGGLMSSSKVIPLDEVSNFGRDAVMVPSSESVVSVSDLPELRALVDRNEKLIGKKVYTVEGNEQGSISDVYFDERTGAIMGYTVSGGLLGDFARGTSYLSTDEVTTVGPDLMYVQPQTEQVLESQVGGVQGAVATAGERIGSAREQATQRFAEAGAAGQARLSETSPEEALVGRRTASDVEDEDGTVIVPRGRRLRAEDVQRAKERGRLRAVMQSVAAADAEAAAADAKTALADAGDTAGSLWDQFTAKIRDMTDATGRRLDEEQTKRRLAEIEDAVGRPVTKVILDRRDDVILNFGDIITHTAIQRAYEAGGLDSLLASVYKGTVELSKSEMRAPTNGQATVERSSGGAPVVEDLERELESAERRRAADRERTRQEAAADRERREREREQRRIARNAERRQRQEHEKQDVEETAVTTTRAR